MLVEYMICGLCGSDEIKLAKSHIIPRGFFKKIPSKCQADTFGLDGTKGRKLQNAIYDSQILCRSCESNIMSPLDDYGIKIFRDKFFSYEVSIPERPYDKLIVFEDIENAKVRGFLASVLWRISVSEQLEIKNNSIGLAYEKRIAQDLLKENAPFEYIDVFTMFLTSPVHMGFILPYKQRIELVDTSRDSQPVNGWVLGFPNITLRVSLDKRRHPERTYCNLSCELTNKADDSLVSTSLLEDKNGYSFMALETFENENTIHAMVKALKLRG